VGALGWEERPTEVDVVTVEVAAVEDDGVVMEVDTGAGVAAGTGEGETTGGSGGFALGVDGGGRLSVAARTCTTGGMR
jgi:hypothetical protein